MADVKQGEVSLADLWAVLVMHKKKIAVVWLSCVLAGLVYVLTATPIYKAEVYMLPPSMQDVQPLKVSLSVQDDAPILTQGSSLTMKNRVDMFSPEQVYNLFVQTLKSRANRRDFYEDRNIGLALGQQESDDAELFFEEAFNEKLVVSRNIKKEEQANFVSLSFEGKDAILATEWVNAFVATTAQMLSVKLAEQVHAKADAAKESLRGKINSKIKLAQKRRADRVVVLKEALLIAKSLSDHDKNLKSVRGSVSLNTGELPLYMFSVAALKAEVRVLESRQDDAPFIEGLRDLEEKLATLEQVKVNATLVNPVFIDQQAVVAAYPIKPNKLLIMFLVGLAGLMLGVLYAFLYQATGQTRARKIAE